MSTRRTASTNDGVSLPCQNVSTSTGFEQTYLSGHDEADIAHGILSELALEGFTTGPLRVSPVVAQQDKHAACVAQAKDIYARADQLNDLDARDARDALLETVPNCD